MLEKSVKILFLVHLSSLECFCCRLDQLAEAQSLAEDFQSMQRALRSLFSETERKLNAVDIASADNVEAMQNQLHEAKVSLIFAVYCFGLWTYLLLICYTVTLGGVYDGGGASPVSLQTTDHKTCCSGRYYYLLVVCSKNGFISHRFRDITTFTVYVNVCNLENFFSNFQ